MVKMKESSREDVFKNGGRIAGTSYLHPSVEFSYPLDIADNVTIYENSQIGQYSYINVGSVLYANSHIGKFCSIGRFVEIGLAKHPIDWLSTHPFQCRNSLFGRYKDYSDIKRLGWKFHEKTNIGHDVWIGAKVNIASGVNIGHGAIIAAGAVVTKDVPPYAIVGGIPAKIIRYRFSESIIHDLLELEWWHLDINNLMNLPFNDINECIKLLKKIRNK